MAKSEHQKKLAENIKKNLVENTKEVRLPVDEESEGVPKVITKETREKRAVLEYTLANLRCRHCNSLGNWVVVKTTKLVRHIKCGVCSKNSTIPAKGNPTKTLRSGDMKKLIQSETKS